MPRIGSSPVGPLLWVVCFCAMCPGFALATHADEETARSKEEQGLAGLVANVSNLLDTLLAEENYDRQIRPGFGGEPTVILTDVEIRSFGPVSENDMFFSMDCYFRQTWWDKRLVFSKAGLDVLSMDWKFLQKVWTPDTYFLNGKNSHLHRVTTPNKFIRVRQDGQLKYSMRLTINANCPMHLRKYPLDTQACPLEIGSFGYTSRDVIYKWKGSDPVALSKDATLSQYKFLSITSINKTSLGFDRNKRSSVLVRFILQRRRGYFYLQIYAPCAMIVGASWVSFWINRSDPAGRVAVGAMTVLTLVTMGFTGRVALPRVNYPTALDWFVIMCFTFVFAALVEYACVNFLDRFQTARWQRRIDKRKAIAKAILERQKDSDNVHLHLPIEEGRRTPIKVVPQNCVQRLRSRFKRKRRYKEMLAIQQQLQLEQQQSPGSGSGIMDETTGPPSIGGAIDYYARLFFPLTFAVLNILYWTLYLYTIDDEIQDLDATPEPHH